MVEAEAFQHSIRDIANRLNPQFGGGALHDMFYNSDIYREPRTFHSDFKPRPEVESLLSEIIDVSRRRFGGEGDAPSIAASLIMIDSVVLLPFSEGEKRFLLDEVISAAVKAKESAIESCNIKGIYFGRHDYYKEHDTAENTSHEAEIKHLRIIQDMLRAKTSAVSKERETA